MDNRTIKRKIRRFWALNLLAAWVLPFLPRLGENASALTAPCGKDTVLLLLGIQTMLIIIAMLRIRWYLPGYLPGSRNGRSRKPSVQFVLPETECFGRHLPAILYGNEAAIILIGVAAELRAPEWAAVCIPGLCVAIAAVCAAAGGRKAKNDTAD